MSDFSVVISEDTAVELVEGEETILNLDEDDVVVSIEVAEDTTFQVDDVASLAVDVVETGPPGPTGPTSVVPGPEGPIGPQGPPGTGSLSYVHVQAVPSDTWIIVHSLGVEAINVTVVDSAGTVMEGDVNYDNINQMTITFSSAFSGKAYFS